MIIVSRGTWSSVETVDPCGLPNEEHPEHDADTLRTLICAEQVLLAGRLDIDVDGSRLISGLAQA